MKRTTAWLAGAAVIALAAPALAQETQTPPSMPDAATPEMAPEATPETTAESVSISVGAEVRSSDGQVLGTVSGGDEDSITVQGADGVSRELGSDQITVGEDGMISAGVTAADYGAMDPTAEDAGMATQGATPPVTETPSPAPMTPAAPTPMTDPMTDPMAPSATTPAPTASPTMAPSTTTAAPPAAETATPADDEDDSEDDPSDGETPTPQA